MIKIGSRLPAVSFKYLGEKGLEDIALSDLCAHKKIILFAVPGAFTPTCSTLHAPGFLAHVADFQKKGVDHLICLAVNDPFVMKAWADSLHAENHVLFLGDGNGEFTEKVGMVLNARANGLGMRSKRYVLLAENGIVKDLAIEGNPGSCTLSSAASFLVKI